MNIEIYDTTLRDGAQQSGISLSVEDKLAITKKLDELGVAYIEGGYAGANSKEDQFFERVQQLDLRSSVVTSFGNTRRAGVPAAEDTILNALINSNTSVVTLVGKANIFQVRTVLGVSVEENLAMVADSVEFIKSHGRRVFFDAEHFFDGYKDSPDYALQVLRTAASVGAERLVLCDTNGGTLPHEVAAITASIKSQLPDAVLGIHAHNDTDTAVASTIAAAMKGASQLQACVNGYGERTGNANLISVIANLQLKLGIECIAPEKLDSLTSVAHFIAEKVNRRLSPFQPYVGSSAFTHKGGLHASGVAKSPQAYQHIDPEAVGNTNNISVSDLSGRSNVMHRIKELNLEDALDLDAARRIVNQIKLRESMGYSYESANASLELLLRREIPTYKAPFETIDFKVLIHGSIEQEMVSEASVKILVDGKTLHTVAEGNGPVSSMDRAMRKALIEHYPELRRVKLVDYKVRVVNDGIGTGAQVRVTIESADEEQVWVSVGASTNILEASWLALADSIEWWLMRQGGK